MSKLLHRQDDVKAHGPDITRTLGLVQSILTCHVAAEMAARGFTPADRDTPECRAVARQRFDRYSWELKSRQCEEAFVSFFVATFEEAIGASARGEAARFLGEQLYSKRWTEIYYASIVALPYAFIPYLWDEPSGKVEA